jgi:chromate reductase
MRPLKILAIAGSLRTASVNAAFLRTVAHQAPPTVRVQVFTGLGELPLFNPDIAPQGQASVMRLYRQVEQADALLIASPEYAHGISGVMKNALDWLVGYEGFVGKSVAVVNTSPRAHHAFDALKEVLQTMSARIIEPASISFGLLGVCVEEDAMRASPVICAEIAALLSALVPQDHPASGKPNPFHTVGSYSGGAST